MSKQFSLAGLLRFRKMEEDTSRQRLAEANANLSQTLEEAGGLHSYLATTHDRTGPNASLAAIAASRAATSGLLAILDMEADEHRAEVDRARADYQGARGRSRGLEKLQERHDEEVAAEELGAEQNQLDELAAGTWARRSANS